VHSDDKAAELAHMLNARAFTIGTDIVFGTGEYKTHSSEGRNLIAHELTHIIQQNIKKPTKENHKLICRQVKTLKDPTVHPGRFKGPPGQIIDPKLASQVTMTTSRRIYAGTRDL
jgi:hypothetical protein